MEIIEKSNYFSFTYELKENTKTSYYLKKGEEGYLPERIGLGKFAEVKHNEKTRQRIGELKAQYKITENGKYKNFTSTRTIHTSLWSIHQRPGLQYGVIDERFKTYDLLILESPFENKSELKIHLFVGFGKPELFDYAVNYILK